MSLKRALLVAAVVAGAYVVWSGRTPQAFVEQAARIGLHIPSNVASAEQKPASRPAQPPVSVSTVVAEAGDMALRRRTIGFAEPIASVALKARLDSQMMEQRVRDGQDVQAGDILFTLDDRELKAQIARDEATLARDKALLERANADLVRKRDLVTKGAATPQQVDQAVSDAAAATATVAADESALNLDRVKLGYTIIRAPIAGRVGAVQVTPGNLVKANDSTALATITQITPIRVTFPLPEQELGKVQAALRAGAPPPVRTFAAGSQSPIAIGKVDFLDSAVDVTSGTVTVKAVFDNPDAKLWPGQYLDVDIEVGRVTGAAIVATVAVQPGQNGPYVFAVKPDQTVEIRPVKVAATEGGSAAITAGLKPGDRVVTDGQMRLVEGARVADRPAPQEKPAVGRMSMK